MNSIVERFGRKPVMAQNPPIKTEPTDAEIQRGMAAWRDLRSHRDSLSQALSERDKELAEWKRYAEGLKQSLAAAEAREKETEHKFHQLLIYNTSLKTNLLTINATINEAMRAAGVSVEEAKQAPTEFQPGEKVHLPETEMPKFLREQAELGDLDAAQEQQ